MTCVWLLCALECFWLCCATGVVPGPPSGIRSTTVPAFLPRRGGQQQQQQQTGYASNLLPPPGAFNAGLMNGDPLTQPPPIPAPSAPAVSRQLSALPTFGGGMATAMDWRASVSVEERINLRAKLRAAYSRHCPSYESLLDTVCAIEEELLFACATARIDYMKSGIDWDSRIQIKRQQLRGGAVAGSTQSNTEQNGHATDATTTSRKRSAAAEDSYSNPNADLLPNASIHLPSVDALVQQQQQHNATDNAPATKKKRT